MGREVVQETTSDPVQAAEVAPYSVVLIAAKEKPDGGTGVFVVHGVRYGTSEADVQAKTREEFLALQGPGWDIVDTPCHPLTLETIRGLLTWWKGRVDGKRGVLVQRAYTEQKEEQES